MKSNGSFTIITDKSNTMLLLIMRMDFPIWDLPGGKVEHGKHSLRVLSEKRKRKQDMT